MRLLELLTTVTAQKLTKNSKLTLKSKPMEFDKLKLMKISLSLILNDFFFGQYQVSGRLFLMKITKSKSFVLKIIIEEVTIDNKKRKIVFLKTTIPDYII